MSARWRFVSSPGPGMSREYSKWERKAQNEPLGLVTWQGNYGKTIEKLWKTCFLLLWARHVDISRDGGLLDQMSCYLQHRLLRGLQSQNIAYHFGPRSRNCKNRVESIFSYWYIWYEAKKSTTSDSMRIHGAPVAPPSHTVAPCKAGSCPTFAQVSRVRASWLSQDRAARLLKSAVFRKKLENYSEMWTMVQKACRLEHRHTCKIDHDRRYRGTSSQPLPARLSSARSAHL